MNGAVSGPGIFVAKRGDDGTFSALGTYVLQVTAYRPHESSSTLTVTVEPPPPPTALTPVVTTRHTITSRLWAARTRGSSSRGIPHCIDQITRRSDVGPGGMDNFIEAAKALRGEPHGTQG